MQIKTNRRRLMPLCMSAPDHVVGCASAATRPQPCVHGGGMRRGQRASHTAWRTQRTAQHHRSRGPATGAASEQFRGGLNTAVGRVVHSHMPRRVGARQTQGFPADSACCPCPHSCSAGPQLLQGPRTTPRAVYVHGVVFSICVFVGSSDRGASWAIRVLY